LPQRPCATATTTSSTAAKPSSPGATNANFYTVLAYTDPELRGTRNRYKGMSFFVVDRDWDGVSVGKPFDKMGQHASDTAEVIFDNVKVPASHLLGQEGARLLHRHAGL
jgi:acyl-CoA dehydrogenase